MSGIPVPPRDVQQWVGSFERDEDFIRTGRWTVDLMVDLAALSRDQAVLDVGCGCGRVARALTDYLSPMAATSASMLAASRSNGARGRSPSAFRPSSLSTPTCSTTSTTPMA